MLRLPSRCLVVLVGVPGSGKSTWAAASFRPEQILSSDALRGVVGESPRDQRASKDAFRALDLLLELRLGRRLLTVVDTTGLDAERRRAYVEAGRAAGLPVHAILIDTDPAETRRRNAARAYPVPQRVLRGMRTAYERTRAEIADEGFDGVHLVASDDPVVVVPPALLDAPRHARQQQEAPVPLSFGLSIPRFTWEGDLGVELARVAGAAEEAGFHSLWVMDHLMQIPSMGPHHEAMPESWTTLAYLAGVTERIELGTLVTGVGYRNLAHLGKIVATLDVLSAGRAWCGLGAGWFEREEVAYGYGTLTLDERYARLEDALELLPLLWGPGAPAYEGRTIQVPEAVCYPRPVREPRPPILVGGTGERRTLRLAAEHADACNIPGDVALVRRKVEVLRAHCQELGRDPDEVLVTQLGDALTGRTSDEVARLVDEQRRADRSRETTAERINAGTVEDQVGRYRELADAGVGLAIVSLPPVATVEAIERFAPVVAAFS